jgi:hypothetical protein
MACKEFPAMVSPATGSYEEEFATYRCDTSYSAIVVAKSWQNRTRGCVLRSAKVGRQNPNF